MGFLLAALCHPPLRAATRAPEADVKAALLFHLTHYVTWPAASNTAPFTIGILGPDPFNGVLHEVVRGEKMGARPIIIVQSDTVEDLKNCSLIYVSPDARESLRRIFRALRNAPVLTVGETADFIGNGGMIRFARNEAHKIRLHINLDEVRRAGLNVSAQLLRVADVVRKGGAQ